MIFLEYPKCSTCKKAALFLDNKGLKYTRRNIVEDKPAKEELREWIKISGRDIKTFFNTSGNLYKELNLKDKLASMSDDEKIELLASNGMLVKRPLLIYDDVVLSGFRENIWNDLLK